MARRVHPFPVAHPVYEHSFSVYPDKLRVSMDDGKVVDYRIDIQQPRPVLTDALKRFDKACGVRRRRRK